VGARGRGRGGPRRPPAPHSGPGHSPRASGPLGRHSAAVRRPPRPAVGGGRGFGCVAGFCGVGVVERLFFGPPSPAAPHTDLASAQTRDAPDQHLGSRPRCARAAGEGPRGDARGPWEGGWAPGHRGRSVDGAAVRRRARPRAPLARHARAAPPGAAAPAHRRHGGRAWTLRRGRDGRHGAGARPRTAATSGAGAARGAHAGGAAGVRRQGRAPGTRRGAARGPRWLTRTRRADR
jgi:hypothetical protein